LTKNCERSSGSMLKEEGKKVGKLLEEMIREEMIEETLDNILLELVGFKIMR